MLGTVSGPWAGRTARFDSLSLELTEQAGRISGRATIRDDTAASASADVTGERSGTRVHFALTFADLPSGLVRYRGFVFEGNLEDGDTRLVGTFKREVDTAPRALTLVRQAAPN